MNKDNISNKGVTVGAALQQMNIWEQKYYDITELFALNEELLQTVEKAADPEAQLAMVAPLAEVIAESADLLTEEYIGLCDHKPTEKKRSAKSRIEAGLRRIYVALHEFETRVQDTKNVALLVVKKIKRQMELVVSHFIDFLRLSLDRVMQKNDIEELRARHANIALMLHQIGQGT